MTRTTTRPYRHPRWLRAPLLAALLVAAPLPPAAAAPLTLSAAIQRALAGHPQIASAELDLRAERARRDDLARTSPWILSAELENVAGSGEFTGLDRAETTLAVSKLLERGDKPQLRQDMGDAAVGVSHARHEALRVAVASQAADAFMTTLAAQRRVQVSLESRRLAQTIRDTVQRRVDVGRSAEAELATADISLVRARSIERRAAGALEIARRNLAAAMAAPETDPGTLSGDLFALPPRADFAALAARLDGNPELARLRQEQLVRAAEQRLARAERRTDLTLGAGVRRLAESDDTALLLSLSVPLGQRRRAEPATASADARAEAAPLIQQARRLELRAELFDLNGHLDAAADDLHVLQEEIVPLAERAVNLYERGFERGRYSLFELNAAQQALLEARRDAIDRAYDYQRLAIRIRGLLGEMPDQGARP
jgi:cobalt-zinc-cadmium efflux system outer membrane protein